MTFLLALLLFFQDTTFPPRAQALVDAVYVQHQDLASGNEDAQRALTKMIAEQIAFELGPQWGVKSAGPGRPQGPSNIAFNGGDHLVGWRWSDGDGHVTGTPGAPLHPPVFLDLTGQVFIPVTPTNHLGGAPPTPPGPPEPPAPSEVAVSLLRIEGKLETLQVSLAALQDAEAKDTEKIQTQIDTVVKNVERSATPLLLKILSLGLAR